MIHKIMLKNFKCFDEIEIPLNNLTILAGSNGSGKSTIIQAMLLLSQSYKKNHNWNFMEFVGEYIYLGYSNDVMNEFNEDDSLIKVGIVCDEGEIIQLASYESSVIRLTAQTTGQISTDNGLINKDFEYISADRIVPNKVFSMFDDGEGLGIHGERVMHFLSLYGNQRINKEICKDDIYNSLVAQLDYWLGELFNGIKIKFEEVVKTDTISLRFQEVSSKEISNERRPINVGFGITYILPVLVALLKATPGDLVVVENPECHLHPSAQRKIGELASIVAQTGVQVVIETHSDHVLNGVRVSVKEKKIAKERTQILFVDREDIGNHFHTNVYSPQILDNGDLDVWPDGFFDEWDNALISLMR